MATVNRPRGYKIYFYKLFRKFSFFLDFPQKACLFFVFLGGRGNFKATFGPTRSLDSRMVTWTFRLKYDFVATTWSQDVQKTFPDSLEVFLKNPLRIFHFFTFCQKVTGFSIMSLLQKLPFWKGWKHLKSLQSEKMRFFQSLWYWYRDPTCGRAQNS